MKEFSYQSPLMGTELDVTFIGSQSYKADFQALLEFGQSCESQFSRFDQASELSQLNKQKQMTVSQLFMEAFLQAKFLLEVTNGSFNPLISPSQIGYEADFKTQKLFFITKNQKTNLAFENIEISPEDLKIRLHSDQDLDFGGFLKGWLAQKMASKVKHIPGVIINLGGDIYAQGADIKTPYFELAIDNPVRPEQPIWVRIKDESLATSGTYARKWGEKHHIMNTQTQDSSQSDLVSASVIDGNGAIADGLATVAIVLGLDRAREILDSLAVNYVLIEKDGKVTQSFTA